MDISYDEYFFVEWLILEKGMGQETFSSLSGEQIAELYKEYKQWERGLNKW